MSANLSVVIALVAPAGDGYPGWLVRSVASSLAGVAFGILVGLGLEAAAATSAPLAVRYQDGKLWLKVRDAPAADVLKAVAKKTGVRFVVAAEVQPGPITLVLDGLPLERAIRNLVAAMPKAAGHTMAYAPSARGGTRLVKVTLFGPGKTTAGSASNVYEGDTVDVGVNASPSAHPTPNLEERREKMIAAGVPAETADKVITLTREVQKLQATPQPGTYRAGDLSPDSREQLQPLLERGVPMERAVQMLLLQEHYQQTLKDLKKLPGGAVAMPLPTPRE